jgi:hypothetical protein
MSIEIIDRATHQNFARSVRFGENANFSFLAGNGSKAPKIVVRGAGETLMCQYYQYLRVLRNILGYALKWTALGGYRAVERVRRRHACSS